MDICMRYVSVVRYRRSVQVKSWLEEDGMNVGDYLLLHFSSLWNYELETLANADILETFSFGNLLLFLVSNFFWKLTIVSCK